ncbi:MAG: YncE family protein [Lysobacterales bacterium]
MAGGVAISPDGLRVYVANLRGLLVVDAASNRPVQQLDIQGGAQAAAVSADGSTVFVSGNDGFAAYDSTSLQLINGVPTTRTINIALSPDGARAFVADPDLALFDINLNTWAPGNQWSWQECLHPVDAAVSPNASSLRIVCLGVGVPSTLVTVNIATLEITATLPLQNDPSALAMSSDGNRAYIATPAANAVVVVDTSGAPMVLDTISVGAGPSSLALTKAGDQLYVTNAVGNSVSVIDTATRSVIDTIAVGPAPRTNGDFIGPNEFLLLTGFE